MTSPGRTCYVVVNKRTMRIVCGDGHKHKAFSEPILGIDARKVRLYTDRNQAGKMADQFNRKWLEGTDKRKVGRYEVEPVRNMEEL